MRPSGRYMTPSVLSATWCVTTESFTEVVLLRSRALSLSRMLQSRWVSFSFHFSFPVGFILLASKSNVQS